MKHALLVFLTFASFSTMATVFPLADFEMVSGDQSCEKFVSVIELEKEINGNYYDGFRLARTSVVGTMFEDEGAEDFLNVNSTKVVEERKNSSHGTKYVTESKSKLSGSVLSKTEIVKSYNFMVRTSKAEFEVGLEFDSELLKYSKKAEGSDNWTRNCTYKMVSEY